MSTFDREKKIKNARNNKNSKLIRTAAYVRVSSDEQAKHGFSIDAQKKGLQKYAEERGYMIVEWYIDEGKSARKKMSKRKEYNRLIEDAKQGRFEMIIFKCLDRWFRNIGEYYKAQSVLDSNDINWECSEEDYDTTTRDGRWKLHIYLMLAQDESDKTSERINYVFEHKIRNKEAITGQQPYGYVVKEIDGQKRVVKDMSVANIIMDIIEHFELYNSKRATLRYVHDKYDVDFDYKVVSKALSNTYLYGHYRGVDGYVWDGGYITKERFDRIQRMVKKNVKDRKRKSTTDLVYIFSGLLRCSECGNNLTGGFYYWENSEGVKVPYKSYRCNASVIHHSCDAHATISEKKLEKKLIQSIEHEIDDYICNYELSTKKEEFKPKTDVKDIKEEMRKLNIQWRKNRITDDEYEYEFERLEKKLEKIEQDAPTEKDLTPLYEFINSGWRNIYDTLDCAERRALWRSVIDFMEVDLPAKNFEIHFI